MQTAQPNLFTRPDTFFGVCQGLGEDLRFHPNILRLALAGLFFWSPYIAVAGLRGAGPGGRAAALAHPGSSRGDGSCSGENGSDRGAGDRRAFAARGLIGSERPSRTTNFVNHLCNSVGSRAFGSDCARDPESAPMTVSIDIRCDNCRGDKLSIPLWVVMRPRSIARIAARSLARSTM
jgi:hypothetical protein